MMKAAMRMQTTQVNPKQKITASTTFDRALYCMAGYVNFQVLCVGAAGGKAGIAWGNDDSVVGGSGGGGGGYILGSGKLADLDQVTSCTVGVAGSDGAVGVYNTSAGSGTDGGDTTFDTFVAYGGHGASGGKVSSTGGRTGSSGGDGGSNSGAYGSAGLGGFSGSYAMSPLPAHYVDGYDPTDGAGTSNGGRGGGGGGGKFQDGTTLKHSASDGAYGAQGTVYEAPPAAAASPYGGTGGGANLEPITGVEEYYGGGVGSKNGAIALLMS
jgi:hypothetical protein